jgi:chromosome segregation ATPase
MTITMRAAALAGVGAAALLCAAASLSAAAQTPKTATLGGGTGSGNAGNRPLLTREELRACLKQQDDIAARRGPLEAQHKQMQDEKAALLQGAESLKDERAKIERTRAAIVELNARQTALGERIGQWNAKVKAATDGGQRLSAAERDALEAERAQLQRDSAQVESDRQALAGHEDAVRAFNTRAAAQDRGVDDWNARNGRLAAQLDALQGERDAWATQCADRRYREEDEIAIRRGQ